jgi:hypothetical protein
MDLDEDQTVILVVVLGGVEELVGPLLFMRMKGASETCIGPGRLFGSY